MLQSKFYQTLDVLACPHEGCDWAKNLLKPKTRNFAIIGRVKWCGAILLIALLFACGETTSSSSQTLREKPQPEPISVPTQDYKKQIAAIEKERISIASQYRNNSRNAEIIENTRRMFVGSIYEKIIPHWYETEWDFYGTTETPREGKIACGYFVTTILRDAGLRVERVKLARQASEKIILSLTNESHVKRFRNAEIEKFVAAIGKWGAGLYIVGLDFHVGFIVNDGAQTFFIHSSYIEPRRVVREIAADSEILASSKYRVVGKISEDDELLTKWLLQKNILTK